MAWAMIVAGILAAGGAPPDAMTRPYLGAWKVSLTLELSSCPERTAVGVATTPQRWTLSAQSWDIHVKVEGAQRTPSKYEGVYAGSKQELQLDAGAAATARLTGSPQKLEGELIQVQHGTQQGHRVSCAELYHVSAVRP